MPQVRTIFHTFPADFSVDHSKYVLLEPGLCRIVCVNEGVWSNSSVWESLPFAEVHNTQGGIVLVDKVSTDFEDSKKKYPEDGMACVSPGPVWLATARSPAPSGRCHKEPCSSNVGSLFIWEMTLLPLFL